MVEVSAYLILLLFLMFFLWIINKAVRSPELFVDEKGHASFREDAKAYQDLSIIRSNDEDQLAMAEELERQMKKEKPFLDPSLSIQELSEGLSYSTRDLSGLLNSYFKKHFFEYVNEYRIEEAKSMLLDPAYKKTTVLEILYAVGFNSKSSFNTAFKKNTGFTPTEYRKAHP
jgi:AraC-like DNA-binding protein